MFYGKLNQLMQDHKVSIASTEASPVLGYNSDINVEYPPTKVRLMAD